jgi:hypothetical protein
MGHPVSEPAPGPDTPAATEPGEAPGLEAAGAQAAGAQAAGAQAEGAPQADAEAPEAGKEPEAAPPPTPPEPAISPERRVAAVAAGWLAIALVDMAMFASRPRGKTPIGVRALAELVSAGYLLAIGAAITLGVAAWQRFGPRSRIASYVVITLVSWAAGYYFYGVDLSGLADMLARSIPMNWLRMALLTLGLSLSVPIAIVVVRHLVRTWHWAAGLAIGVGAIIANGMEHDYPEMHLFISQSYPGVHTLVAVLAGIAAGLTFERAPVPRFVEKLDRPKVLGAFGVASIWGAAAIALVPSNAVLLELQRYTGAVLFPFLGKAHADVRGNPNVPEGKAEWFQGRDAVAPIPPTLPKILPDDAIVILLGIDSMRAEMLQDEKYRDDLPELFRLRDESIYFSNARAAGSSTAPSIASMFSDVYYSQLYWTTASTDLADTSLVFPHEDKSKRFPELLSEAGVYTETSDGTTWLVNSHGIIRGFQKETSQRHGDYTRAQILLGPILGRLRHPERQKQLYFIHMLDAHSPYTSAGKRSSPFLGYVAELARIDRQMERLMKVIKQKHLLSRVAVIVYSDHGEAFGEHGTKRHAVSLYDELLRVPLMIRIPSADHRNITDPVSLMDIAPTILDMMGVPTPGRFMGQSLAGYLRLEKPKLTRPIVAEARLKRAMVLPDGFKVIYDTQTHVVEIYDLAKDPKEENNLYREGDPVSAERLGVLTKFFDVHTLKRPGYKVPYRKW